MWGTEGGLHDPELSLMILDIDNSETGPEEHLEQVSSVFLVDERT